MKTKPKNKSKYFSLATCTRQQLLQIGRDNTESKDFWLITNCYDVSIFNQKNGQPASQRICIPRPVFNRLVRLYQMPRKAIRK